MGNWSFPDRVPKLELGNKKTCCAKHYQVHALVKLIVDLLLEVIVLRTAATHRINQTL